MRRHISQVLLLAFNLPSQDSGWEWTRDAAGEELETQEQHKRLPPCRPYPEKSVSHLILWIFHLREQALIWFTLSVKLKFNFKGTLPWVRPFVDLLQGRRDEIILRKEDQLHYISNAADAALKHEGADVEKLEQLKLILSKKIGFAGTKAQIKPSFDEQGECEKLGIVVKWGGEVSGQKGEVFFFFFRNLCSHPLFQFTHAGRYQSRDLGENMRKDLTIMSKCVYPSSAHLV
jgi:hypothetical protein